MFINIFLNLLDVIFPCWSITFIVSLRSFRTRSIRFKKLYIKKYDNVSILFADIVNSVALTEKLSANELVETLDNMFGTFDKCADKNNCLRIKLLGDCYYCVSGLPIPDSNHAWNSVRMGFDMIKIILFIQNIQ